MAIAVYMGRPSICHEVRMRDTSYCRAALLHLHVQFMRASDDDSYNAHALQISCTATVPMPLMPILPPEDATTEVRAVYEDFHRRMAFPSPPNFITTQGHSPVVARGTWDVVRNVLVLGEIPRWIKEMMFVAISKDRDCRYCTAAHIACCRMLGVSQSLMDALSTNIEGIPDPKVKALVLFALKCSRNPQGVDAGDYAALRVHGLKQSEIMEAIAMSAFAVYANIIADATGMDPDEMFGTP